MPRCLRTNKQCHRPVEFSRSNNPHEQDVGRLLLHGAINCQFLRKICCGRTNRRHRGYSIKRILRGPSGALHRRPGGRRAAICEGPPEPQKLNNILHRFSLWFFPWFSRQDGAKETGNCIVYTFTHFDPLRDFERVGHLQLSVPAATNNVCLSNLII